MKRAVFVGCSLLLAVAATPDALEGQNVFRSTQSANLPTAVMLSRGNVLFEVSHRFDTPISQGADGG